MNIPDNIAYDVNINPAARICFGLIAACCKKDGFCQMTYEDFVMTFDVSRPSIYAWLLELEEKDLIRWHRGHGKRPHKIYLNGKHKEKAL